MPVMVPCAGKEFRARRWAAAFCWLALGACSLVAPKFERPDISVSGIELIGGNLLKQNFLVKLTVQNPNDRPIPVTGLHAELNVAGDRLASGVSNQPFVVPPHGTSDFDMTVTANLALALLKLGSQSDGAPHSIDYEVTGEASLDLPFLHQLPFHQKGSFSLGGR